MGKNEAFVTLLRKLSELEIKDFVHFLLHQENVCAKTIGFKNGMQVIVTVVNFIRAIMQEN